MSIGVAILGGGIFAREQHLPAVNASKDLTLKAVYSRSLKSAQSLNAGDAVELYSEDSGEGKSLDALLTRSDIHAVIIALTIKGQPEYIRKALAAGKHVLSEKPIAENLEEAQKLISWYQENAKGVTWSIAENLRWYGSVRYGREEIAKIGRITEFRVRVHTLVTGGKYFETPWRKVPEYQGGFLLDGGVHYAACLRYLLGGAGDKVTRLSAFSNQIQPHLPPVDTLDAIMRTQSGATGTYSVSFGTTFERYSEYAITGEKGTVTVNWGSVTVKPVDKDAETKEFPDEGMAVTPEVKAWGEGLAAGKPQWEQSPEEALADLELIERMLRSGEAHGAPADTTLQKL